MPKQRRNKQILWHFCYCGCAGWETIYRGRYFWRGQIMGAGPHLLFTKHAGWGFHVGKFSHKSVVDVNKTIRDEYKEYSKAPRLTWHICPCGRCTRITVCLKGRRFWAMWCPKIGRALLFQSHKGGVVGVMTRRQLDERVREIARKSRDAFHGGVK